MCRPCCARSTYSDIIIYNCDHSRARYICTAAKQTAPAPARRKRRQAMSKLKKLLPKRDLRARWLWVLALALTAVKLGLCSFQLIVASPDLSPIDDTLMFNLAKSISAGNWLGEYDWLTLGKHSFYALWLAF